MQFLLYLCSEFFVYNDYAMNIQCCLPPSGPRRGPWDPPEDDPIGVLPDPQPVGEPLILLLFAAFYIVYRKHKKHLKHTEL